MFTLSSDRDQRNFFSYSLSTSVNDTLMLRPEFVDEEGVRK